MGVSRDIRNYTRRKRHLKTPKPPPGHSPAAIATRCLDAALRVWDEDRTEAKSQIKAAVAILRAEMDGALSGLSAHGLVPWQARKVHDFIEASLGEKIRLQDCASTARLSVSHFSRAFKATFGTTVLDYVHRRRVECAQQLMLASVQSLSQIALRCGFADQAHYCRVFRAVVGVSPNAWRRRNMPEASDDQIRLKAGVAGPTPGRSGWVPASNVERRASGIRPLSQQNSGRMPPDATSPVRKRTPRGVEA